VEFKGASKLVKSLRKQEGLTHFAAKDILRASGLPLLGSEDSEVAVDLEKVQLGQKLSPVLLIQGSPLWVADGYNRVCASYHLNEKTELSCRIVARGEKVARDAGDHHVVGGMPGRLDEAFQRRE
jgi:hypothetical protein